MTKTLEPRVSDWWFIGLDETRHWNIPTLKQHVAKITTVYAFDRSQSTCCCEFTPSYWLVCVDFQVDYLPGVIHRPDFETIREELDDILRGVPKEESDNYTHVRVVEGLLNRPDTEVPRYHVGDIPEDRDADNGEVLDAVFELWERNPKF